MPLPAVAGATIARSLASRFLLPLLRFMGRWVAIPLVGVSVPFFFKVGIFFTIVGIALKISGQLINWGIAYQTLLLNPETIPIIRVLWTTLRDFANIFFILILLVIAFATIFNVKDYKASDLLPKLIIAALLINFSLVITVWVIDLLWTPAMVFLSPFRVEGTIPPTYNVSEKIANALSLQNLFTPENIEVISGEDIGILGTGLTQVFRSLLLVVNAFVTIWIAFIIWARIPILIGLMIVSPIIWLGYALPAVRKNTWEAWWATLINWGIIPIPLFGLIYFVVLFSQRLAAEIQVLPAETLTANISPLGLTAEVVLPWLITVGLFLGGLAFVKGLSGNTYGWAMSGLKRTWGWAGMGAAGAYRATGLAGGLEQAKKGLEREGLFGTRAREAREAAVARGFGRTFGVPGYTIQSETVNQTEKVAKEIENKLKLARTPEEEKEIIASAFRKGLSSPEGLAGFLILAKRGNINAGQAREAIEKLKNIPLLLTKAFSEWKEGKFGGITHDEFMGIMRNQELPIDARRIMYSFAASDDGKKTAEKMEQDDFNKGLQILGRNTKTGRDYFKFWADFRPTYVVNYRFNENNREKEYSKEDLEKIKTVADAMKTQIEKASVKDLTDYSYKEWDPKINKCFLNALKEVIRDKKDKDGESARKFVVELRRKLRREGKDSQLGELNKITTELNMEIREGVVVEQEIS